MMYEIVTHRVEYADTQPARDPPEGASGRRPRGRQFFGMVIDTATRSVIHRTDWCANSMGAKRAGRAWVQEQFENRGPTPE
jgi:hypothetical protein